MVNRVEREAPFLQLVVSWLVLVPRTRKLTIRVHKRSWEIGLKVRSNWRAELVTSTAGARRQSRRGPACQRQNGDAKGQNDAHFQFRNISQAASLLAEGREPTIVRMCIF